METEQGHSAIGRLTVAGWFSRALAVTARLGVADILGEQYMTAEEIAKRTKSNPDVMLRIMRALTFCGAARRDENGAFAITEDFAQLRSDHPLSVRHVVMLFAELYDDAFGQLQHTVQTGKSGFQQVFGEPLFEYLENHPDDAHTFDQAMVELARPVAVTLLRAHDFSDVRTIVDVGGGGGAMLRGVLAGNPHLTGVSTDRPSTCERARADLASSREAHLAERLTFQPADIFTELPAGGDRYFIKNVLHDWSFDSCKRILGTIADAMNRTEAQKGTKPRLLIIEPPITEDFDAARELFQMVACEEGMYGLTVEGMRDLVDVSGFELLSIESLPTGHNVYECMVRTS